MRLIWKHEQTGPIVCKCFQYSPFKMVIACCEVHFYHLLLLGTDDDNSRTLLARLEESLPEVQYPYCNCFISFFICSSNWLSHFWQPGENSIWIELEKKCLLSQWNYKCCSKGAEYDITNVLNTHYLKITSWLTLLYSQYLVQLCIWQKAGFFFFSIISCSSAWC